MMRTLRNTCITVAMIAITSLLSACGTSPQRLYVNPQVGEMGVVGHGQQIVVGVIDKRPSERIGSRDGATNASSYLVVPTGDLTPKLEAQTISALRRMGFVPVSAEQANPGASQLTISLTELAYGVKRGGLITDTAALNGVIQAVAVSGQQRYTGSYTATRDQGYALKPSQKKNTELVSKVIGDALTRAFQDTTLIRQLDQ
ncbi:YajG family lipoprotein [Cobetia sp. QF-1]|uniref:YajG family lipoprotein n=1 Tax=Cobetia sp. QF-1 TaxID=1969833 RepID=UPI000B542EDC|nr:YajG family lipoprotein [Cobetia sp. QF-1]